MIFDTNYSYPPNSSFNANKIRGYKAQVNYLTGEDTVVYFVSQYYSIAGIKLELEGRFRWDIFTSIKVS